MKSSLLLPGLAFLLGCLSVSALAQDLQSLDELVKAAGCTPVIDGGTGGTGSTAQYHSSYGPEKAFDGITYSTDHTTRWLGSIQNGTYLLYALPEEYSSPFQLQGYRVHTLSIGDYAQERSPRSWELYGNTDAGAAADADTWELIDGQSDIVWPFASGDYDSSVAGSQYVLEFSVTPTTSYRAFKFVPLTSARPSSSDTWTTGLMELVFLGYERPADNSVLIEGNQNTVGATTPAYGELSGLASGDTVELSAEEFAYTDTTRYTCIGYTTEIMQDDGSWIMEGTNLVRSATYTHDGQTRRITWLWEEHGYKLTAGLEFGGLETISASPEAEADGYYTAGAEVTLTLVCATNPVSTFKNWYGDVPEGSETVVPLAVTIDAPKTIYADFSRHWKFVDGNSSQITDGNFVLRIDRRDDGTYAIGVNDGNRGYISGSGFLDLSDVTTDLGIEFSWIRVNSFLNCTNLITAALPESLVNLDSGTFMGCTYLRSVQVSPSLRTIGGQTFQGCTALQSVTPFLPDSVESIGQAAFAGCTNLTGNLVLNNANLTSIPEGAFNNCRKIDSVNLGVSGVTSIGGYAFKDCQAMTHAVLPSGLQRIGSEAFRYNYALETVTPFLPETVQSIGSQAFENCTVLTGDLKLQNPGLTSIGMGAFAGDSKLSSVDMSGSGVTTLSSYAFSDSGITNAVLSDCLETVEAYAFNNNTALRAVTPFLPETVRSIGTYAFRSCSSLETPLRLSNPELTKLGGIAFGSMTMLPSVDMSGCGITSIGSWTFSGNKNMTNAVLPGVLQRVEDHAVL